MYNYGLLCEPMINRITFIDNKFFLVLINETKRFSRLFIRYNLYVKQG